VKRPGGPFLRPALPLFLAAMAVAACEPQPTELVTVGLLTALTADANRIYWVEDATLLSCEPSEARCTPRVLSSDFPATRLEVDDTHVFGANNDGSLRSVPLGADQGQSTLVASGCEMNLFALDSQRAYCLRWSAGGHRLEGLSRLDGTVESSFPVTVNQLTLLHSLVAGAGYVFLGDGERLVAISKSDGSVLPISDDEAHGLILAPGSADHLLWLRHSSESFNTTLHSAEQVEGAFVDTVFSDLGIHVESLFATSGRVLAISEPRAENSTVYEYELDFSGPHRRAHAVGGYFNRLVATGDRIVVANDYQLLAYPYRF